MDSETDVCIEKKTLVVIVVALLILSFSLGWGLAERTPYCALSVDDMDDAWSMVGKGDLNDSNYSSGQGDFRFIHEDMTLKQVKEQYDFYKPISVYLMRAFLSGVCE